MAQLSAPWRATIGLIATLVEDPRRLPLQAIELPVTLVSTAMRMSLRTQQRYAAWVAKGDDVLAQLRGYPEEPPKWATFDEPVDAAHLRGLSLVDGFDDPLTEDELTVLASVGDHDTALASVGDHDTALASVGDHDTVPARRKSSRSRGVPRDRLPSPFDEADEEIPGDRATDGVSAVDGPEAADNQRPPVPRSR